MPAPKTYTRAQWDEFARLLDALPEKPPSERRITVREAMSDVRTHINAARAKGYSLDQLMEQARQAGIDVTTSALRYALQETKKRRATNQRTGESRSASCKGNSATNQSTHRTARQQTSPASRTNTESENGKLGSMVVQDAFSFQIRPDIKDI
jgi:post-segregation antitoxin (ccd killing protein)